MKRRRSLLRASRSSSRRPGKEQKLLTRKRTRKQTKRLRKKTMKSLQKKKLWKKRKNRKRRRKLRMPKRRSISFSLSQMVKDQNGRTLH